jgi:DNA-binding cell septation regulator SpoVG
MIAATIAEAVGFGGRPPERRMRLVSWRPVTKGSLRGFATVELPIGLKLHDVLVFVGRNGAWASLPSKAQIDRDGRQKTEANGKAMYAPVLEWRSRDLSDRFSEAVVALVRAAHPDDLDSALP